MTTGQNEGQKSVKRKYSVPLKTWHKYSLISCISAKLVICLTHVSNFAWVTSGAFRLLSSKHCFSFWIAMKSETTRKKIYFKSFKIAWFCAPEPWGADYFPVSCVSAKTLLVVAYDWGLLGPVEGLFWWASLSMHLMLSLLPCPCSPTARAPANPCCTHSKPTK